MSRNEITGDEIKSKVNTKEYEDNYDRIFKRKPQSLDAAYERRAMMQGLVVNPLFPENKEMIEDWPDTEERIDIIAQNGPTGEHYFNVTDCECKEFKENKD